MVIIANANGTIIKSIPEMVYQGSNNANSIVLLAPFSANAQVTIAFRLPDGTLTESSLMTKYTDVENAYDLNGWTCDISDTITALYGQVDMQFKATLGTTIIASFGCSFTVQKGVAPILPATPTQTIYEQILTALSELQADILNGWLESKALLPYDSTFTYSINANVFDKATMSIYTSLVSNNVGNALTDTTSWEQTGIATTTDLLNYYTKTQIDAQETNLQNQITANATGLTNHIEDLNNPHQVTKTQVGLGNVDNTSDLSKPVSTATQTELNKKVNIEQTNVFGGNTYSAKIDNDNFLSLIKLESHLNRSVISTYSYISIGTPETTISTGALNENSRVNKCEMEITPTTATLQKTNDSIIGNKEEIATQPYVNTQINNAISGAIIYKGIWTTTAETTDYSALNSFRPIKSGWRWEVGGTGCTIDNVQYLPTDFITFNQDCGADTTITTAMIDKTDNTDGVTSVNGQVGNVVLSASDVGATTQSYVDTQDTNLQTQITANATDINEKEDKSNKVTSLSSASTDTQYPSAKCVYDIVGNIVSLMEEL